MMIHDEQDTETKNHHHKRRASCPGHTGVDTEKRRNENAGYWIQQRERSVAASVAASATSTALPGKNESLKQSSEMTRLPVERRLRSRIDKFIEGYGLTPMGKAVALNWIQKIGADTSGEYSRVRGWLLSRFNAFGRPSAACCASSRVPGRRSLPEGLSPWQSGCPELIPGLRSKAFWSANELPWVKDFEAGFRDVKEELMSLRGRGGFQPYRAPRGSSCDRPAADGVGSHCHEGGDWNVFYLFLHNVDFSQNRSMCPKTSALVEALPRHYKHAFFSALAPGTHVIKHHGSTNKKLRVHLPLIAPGGGLSRLRVGFQIKEACPGQARVFDDSFEHEAWNDDSSTNNAGSNDRDCSQGRRQENRAGKDDDVGSVFPGPRVTLIADVWHPDLTQGEVRFLAFLQEATLRLEKRAVELAQIGASALPLAVPHGGTRATQDGSQAEEPCASIEDTAKSGQPCDLRERRGVGTKRWGGEGEGEGEWGEEMDSEFVVDSGNQGNTDEDERRAVVCLHDDGVVDNFLGVIDRARSLRPEESKIFGGLPV